MTVQECYAALDGNYEEVLKRMMNKEALIVKFLKKFEADTSFERLCKAIEERQVEEAFREAHTMKGLCQNMAFSGLCVPVEALTECLRAGNCDETALNYFEQVKEKYAVVRAAIKELDD